jgi:hypothetical protein
MTNSKRQNKHIDIREAQGEGLSGNRSGNIAEGYNRLQLNKAAGSMATLQWTSAVSVHSLTPCLSRTKGKVSGGYMNTWAHVKVLLSPLQRDSEPPTSDGKNMSITRLSDLSLCF